MSLTKIQMNGGQGLSVRAITTFSGTYAYSITRQVGGSKDFLGEWTDESPKKHSFEKFSSAHSYEISFRWNHPISNKPSLGVETEADNQVKVVHKYNNFEGVTLIFTREE
jgi:hypothetical protein